MKSLRHLIEQSAKRIFRIFGFSISRISERPAIIWTFHHQEVSKVRALWEEDSEFLIIYDKVKRKTMIDKWRLYILYQLVKQASSLDGNVAELGVYKGGLLC